MKTAVTPPHRGGSVACYYRSSSSSSSSSSSRCKALIVKMGKNKNPPPPSSKGSEPTPPRITSNVKQNLQFLKLWKEFQKRSSSTPKPATSYRKKKAEKEELPEDNDLYRDPTTSLYYTNQGLYDAVPVLLVDGYNVCGYWVKLKKHFMKGRLDIARQKLIDELVTLSMVKEVKVVAVFDAQMSGLPTHKENFAGVDVIFSGETCADAWIEKEARNLNFSTNSNALPPPLKSYHGRIILDLVTEIPQTKLVVALREDGCPKVWVVTSDVCQQQAAHGAGAYVWSCKALISEIKAMHKEVERMIQETRSTSFQGRLLKHNLDSEVVDALKELRDKLLENESKR